MPGSNARAMEKARELPADVIVFDLEDAVAPAAKPAARAGIAKAVAAGGYGKRELIVRVNALGTPWAEDDLAAAAELPIDGVMLPKVESPDTIERVAALLALAGAPDRALWCMLETPLGILRADAIAASPGIAVIVMGTEDLAKDLRAQATPDRAPLLAALSRGLLAARAFGHDAIDGVFADLADDDGFAGSCRQGRAFGFDGKGLIHPKTIAVANRIFGPDKAELERAHRIIAASRAADAAGAGVTLLDGKLVERLHVAAAQRLIALAEAIAQR
jgi:citrate lyase subunit beta / citryl-CoA lyase